MFIHQLENWPQSEALELKAESFIKTLIQRSGEDYKIFIRNEILNRTAMFYREVLIWILLIDTLCIVLLQVSHR